MTDDDRCRLVKPFGDGRQSHYCILPKGHEQQTHRCPCSHEWVGAPRNYEEAQALLDESLKNIPPYDPAVQLTAKEWVE